MRIFISTKNTLNFIQTINLYIEKHGPNIYSSSNIDCDSSNQFLLGMPGIGMWYQIIRNRYGNIIQYYLQDSKNKLEDLMSSSKQILDAFWFKLQKLGLKYAMYKVS